MKRQITYKRASRVPMPLYLNDRCSPPSNVIDNYVAARSTACQRPYEVRPKLSKKSLCPQTYMILRLSVGLVHIHAVSNLMSRKRPWQAWVNMQ
jgi:hypothetical protein